MMDNQKSCQLSAPFPIFTRRDFLERAGAGFGMVAATFLLNRDLALAATAQPTKIFNPLAPKPPHFPAKAKSVIHLFMHGGPSHIDTFDPKPVLAKFNGQKLPPSFGPFQLEFTKASESPLLASRRTFEKCGQSGIEISDVFEHLHQFADDLTVIRSCHHDGFTHGNALNWLNNGWARIGRPSLGSWVVYGLGSESENLPAYVVMLDGGTKGGTTNYGPGFLPAMYQGTLLRSDGTPMFNVNRPARISAHEQREMLDLLKWANERHLEARSDDSNLSARIASYELAFRMQSAVPELVDLSKETEATKKLYGLDNPMTADYGAKCLLARRMVERGVRFVQLYSGGITSRRPDDWDGHDHCDDNHVKMGRMVDRPIAGLLADLKSRGLWDSTLVVWGGEFGRTPVTDQLDGGNKGGRDHNPYGFTTWMAGGGIRGGKIIGATDDIGFRVAEDPVHVHDLHATVLTLLGLDHEKLTYFFQGRNFRLTDVGGQNNLAKRLIAG